MTYFKAQAIREDVTYVFTEYLWTRKCIISTIVALVLLIVVIIVAVVLSSEGSDNLPPAPNSNDYEDVPIVRRSEWGAMPAENNTKIEKLPPDYVIVAHTAGVFCKSKVECIEVVRNIQEDHMWGRHWSDIGYNFLVGGDGFIYEGCQWDIEGAHTAGWNKKSIGIAFTGDYNIDKPTQDQIDAVTKLLTLGVKQNKLTQNYKLLAHMQVVNILSPGENLYNVIKTWKHWSKCPNISEPELCSP